MKLRDKLILVDCDGVLLDWEYSFYRWMKRHGYEPISYNEYEIHKTFNIEKSLSKLLIKNFNESANVGWMPPLRDAVKYVQKLHKEHGFVFHCITSLSLDPFAGKLREGNLKSVFGESVFERIECLDCGADKDEALEQYRDSGCFWIEDKPENAIAGEKVGLTSILVAHDHNQDFVSTSIPRAQNWKEIYQMIV